MLQWLVARTWRAAAVRSLLQMLLALALYHSLTGSPDGDYPNPPLSIVLAVAFGVVLIANAAQSGFLRGVPCVLASLIIVSLAYSPLAPLSCPLNMSARPAAPTSNIRAGLPAVPVATIRSPLAVATGAPLAALSTEATYAKYGCVDPARDVTVDWFVLMALMAGIPFALIAALSDLVRPALRRRRTTTPASPS